MRQAKFLFYPVQRRSYEEVDIEFVVRVSVNEFAVFSVIFQPGTYAAPEALVGLGVDPVVLRALGGKIDETTVRVLRG